MEIFTTLEPRKSSSTFKYCAMIIVAIYCCIVCNFGYGQSISGGCDKVTVTTIPSYSINLYLPYNLLGSDLCQKYSHSPLDLAGVQLILQKFNNTSGNWEDASFPRNIRVAPYEFSDLDPGKYRVLGYKPIMITSSSCPQGRIKVYNTAGQHVGFVCIYDDDEDFISEEIWVGEAEISSSDAAFNEYGFNPTAFNSGQIVKQIRQLERTQIEVSDLMAGLYYLSVFRNDQKIATEKVVIQ